jgi:hypothetical protein
VVGYGLGWEVGCAVESLGGLELLYTLGWEVVYEVGCAVGSVG